METEEDVVLVDEHDRAIGLAKKLLAHQQGLFHRAFSICIFRNHAGSLECLLQQRQWDKYHSAGLWTNTCCSHPRDQEPVERAAQRRLQEEMGFCVPLQKAGVFSYRAILPEGLIEHELDHVFAGWFDDTQTIQIDPSEAASFKWVEVSTLLADVKQRPTCYTQWFLQALTLALSQIQQGLPLKK